MEVRINVPEKIAEKIKKGNRPVKEILEEIIESAFDTNEKVKAEIEKLEIEKVKLEEKVVELQKKLKEKEKKIREEKRNHKKEITELQKHFKSKIEEMEREYKEKYEKEKMELKKEVEELRRKLAEKEKGGSDFSRQEKLLKKALGILKKEKMPAILKESVRVVEYFRANGYPIKLRLANGGSEDAVFFAVTMENSPLFPRWGGWGKEIEENLVKAIVNELVEVWRKIYGREVEGIEGNVIKVPII
jgi:alanyl-tRNA synthetase